MRDNQYLGAWSFESSVQNVWKASYAWKSIKALRLARSRHRSMYQSSNTPSLAYLPTEVLAAIEANIMQDSLSEALDTTPKNECTCRGLWEDFMDTYDTQEAWHDFSDEWGLEEDPEDKDLRNCLWEFEESEECQTLWSQFKEDHVDSQLCEGPEEVRLFWQEVADYLKDGDYDEAMNDFHAFKGGSLKGFLYDHHLEPWNLDDGLQDDERVTLVFRSTIVAGGRNGIPQEIPFPFNRTRVRRKLAGLGLLDAESEQDAGQDQLDLKWITKLDDRYEVDNPYSNSPSEAEDSDYATRSLDEEDASESEEQPSQSERQSPGNERRRVTL